MTGSSTQGIKTVLHPVSDLATAKPVYAALLGVPPLADESYYVGFEAEGQHIGLVLGGTRDVSMIEGEVEVLEIDALPQDRGDRFAARTGFDPRALATPYRWFRISPRRIQV